MSVFHGRAEFSLSVHCSEKQQLLWSEQKQGRALGLWGFFSHKGANPPGWRRSSRMFLGGKQFRAVLWLWEQFPMLLN